MTRSSPQGQQVGGVPVSATYELDAAQNRGAQSQTEMPTVSAPAPVHNDTIR